MGSMSNGTKGMNDGQIAKETAHGRCGSSRGRFADDGLSRLRADASVSKDKREHVLKSLRRWVTFPIAGGRTFVATLRVRGSHASHNQQLQFVRNGIGA